MQPSVVLIQPEPPPCFPPEAVLAVRVIPPSNVSAILLVPLALAIEIPTSASQICLFLEDVSDHSEVVRPRPYS